MPVVRGGKRDGTRTAPSAISLKFLIDNALSPHLGELISAAGYDAVHVRTYGMRAATDEQILARAFDEDRTVVSSDADFATILALQEAERPSFILFRDANLLLQRTT